MSTDTLADLSTPTDLSAYGRQTIEAGSKSFALASRVLAPAIRDDATLLYAYCRFADDLVDGQIMGHGQIEGYKAGQGARVDELRRMSARALAGKRLGLPHYDSLASVVARHDLPHAHIFELIDGFQMDADARVYATLADTLDYAYHVAGVVGVMMAWIMGVRDAATLDRASDLGLAFQLTNIARDVVDDARAGRVFVPREMLAAQGAPNEPSALARPEAWPAAHRAACELLGVADTYYASARHGIAELSYRNGWAILTALRVYRDIGTRLRKLGPKAWTGRVSTGKPRKIGQTMAAAFDAAGRHGITPVPRAPGLYARPRHATSVAP